MPVIAVVNLKGGVGKTSTCFHLGGLLASRKKRVLLVDNDPQASLTQGFWGPSQLRSLDATRSIHEVYANAPPANRVIHHTEHPNLDLIPGHREAVQWNMIPEREWQPREKALRELLRDVDGDYDFILIDCPPNLHLCSHAAILASSWVLVPLQPEDFGSQGMTEVNRAISRAPNVSILGYLLTFYNCKLAIHQVYHERLVEIYHDRVFKTVIPNLTDFKEAVARHRPVCHYKRSSPANRSMIDLADELTLRLLLKNEVAA